MDGMFLRHDVVLGFNASTIRRKRK